MAERYVEYREIEPQTWLLQCRVCDFSVQDDDVLKLIEAKHHHEEETGHQLLITQTE